jgi:cellobiose-specific phosphotransferase system component IIA
MRRLSTPAGRALTAVLAGVALFFFTGWAAGRRDLILNWSSFNQADALLFLGAYAQLVLAAAVFFQIRTADRAVVRQIKADEQRLQSDQADALIRLVTTAGNARSLYVQAIPSLRNVTYHHGDPDALDRAETELLPAEQLRQEAHAARFRVEVMLASEIEVIAAAQALTDALDEQRKGARAVLVWSRTPLGVRAAPDPRDVAVFPDEEQKKLMATASRLVGVARHPQH